MAYFIGILANEHKFKWKVFAGLSEGRLLYCARIPLFLSVFFLFYRTVSATEHYGAAG